MSAPAHDAEELERILRENVWGCICQTCAGSGTTEGNVECLQCKGLGITDWQYKIAIEALLAREKTIKEQAAIEARIDENAKWKVVAEEIVAKDGVYRAVNHLNRRVIELKQQKESL